MRNNLKSNIRIGSGLLKNRLGIHSPVFIQLKATYRCNMKCDFCNLWSEKQGELDTESIKKIIKDSYSLGAAVINFSGGEPLLRKDIAELVSYSKKLGLLTMMNTNGFLLSKYAKKLSPCLDFASVSIDFPDAISHDSFRGLKGAFEAAKKGIIQSQKNGISVKIHCTVTSKNINHLEKMALLARELNTKITFTPVMTDFSPGGKPLTDSGIKVSKLDVVPDLYAKTVFSLKKKYKEIITPNYFIKAVKSQNPKCDASATVINIQPDGMFVLPCEVKPLKKMSALDIKENYNSKALKDMLEKNGSFPFCKKCSSQCSLTPRLLSNPFNALEMFFNWRF